MDSRAAAKALLLAGAAMAFPVGLAEATAPQMARLAEAPASGFTAPDGPLLLTREWRRTMPDGVVIRSARSYRVRFTPDALGFRIDGELVDVLVDVPPKLEALARIERGRREEGLFPIFLDDSGFLREAAFAADLPAVRDAVRIGRERLGSAPLPSGERAAAREFVAALTQQPATAPWPAALFNTPEGRRSETRQVATGDGRTGLVTIETDAERNQGMGQMRRLSRRITTSLDGITRSTDEIWTLRPVRA